MKKYSANKDFHQLIKKLIKMGWLFNHRAKHNELWSPDKSQRIVISASPSDRRAYMKFKSNLRKCGFIQERY